MAFPLRKRKVHPAQTDPAQANHLFDAVPEIAEGVMAATDSRGRLQLKMDLPPSNGIAAFLARALRFRSCVRVNLDEHGTQFWRLIDGRRSLREIEATLRRHWGLDERESKRATVLFTTMLMKRHLVNLKVARRSVTQGATPRHGFGRCNQGR